uniref:Protein Abitram n=1 Tax=Noctiluca scintillans TaxID=2966 RepID=A0A7S1F6E2_NOCSC|mmetsp:Transcript_37910/g.100980  ORF Transcript_37910/g.100980 Transcript_37910/m.100980 type:complete len:187 (+) Transcript_37910:35-595(+)|eukprot:CAMPEP_0194532436 /NCGR_PEP_ID=MMETSP0253-20130528/69980_1 /TAXON_ID=2966 /ORGANISM="Noctiluca scintillans" /LENGTH=186 /DNA_ID=CAMNT_0039377883 /DNA_START=3 /DNA_END=563 /DNA_ORIENTATION=+
MECLDVTGALADTLERSFVRKYRLGHDANGDLYLLRHPNGLLVVGLAPSHPLLQPGAPNVLSASFTDNVSSSEVHGKRKRGGVKLGVKTSVLKLTFDGGELLIPAGAEGKLIEMNERLLQEPHLLQQEPQGEGFIVIVQPLAEQANRWSKGLLDSDEALATERGSAAKCVCRPWPRIAPGITSSEG